MYIQPKTKSSHTETQKNESNKLLKMDIITVNYLNSPSTDIEREIQVNEVKSMQMKEEKAKIILKQDAWINVI